MIVILGGRGYVGSAYRAMLDKHNIDYISLSLKEMDYGCPKTLSSYLVDSKATFLINAAGYTGKPNVDACELDKSNCLFGNAVLPGRIAEACQSAAIPWGHVSSGCIFTGTRADGGGFKEDDLPNFTFRQNNCSYYSGTKALGEEILEEYPNVYIWRLRIPFNHVDGPRNYISKLLRYNKLLDASNSVSNIDEFVTSTYAVWENRIPFGTYNVTNPGVVTTRQVVELIGEFGLSDKEFEFFSSEKEFMSEAAATPRSNCVLDSSKLSNSGVGMSPVLDSLERCMRNWTKEV